MHIDQLSRVTGVSVQTIRHYEQADLLPIVEKISGREDFTEAHIHAIKLIKMAQDIGLSLREIISVLATRDSKQSSKRLNRAIMLLNQQRHAFTESNTDQHDKLSSIDKLENELESLFH